ncbi:MAG TPA: dolichyl-phosphate beta-D-mannosyltransferase [Balneola sp.]|jgi:dolichol-phosphate mannosyltransferase|nr:dolichyl-phosphate beta-D-mannosyltransferase [Balneola sp.]MAO78567.1 dolichyl-phosphate beta-D-mannosyltransferase [Balneola sp.]MBF63203.1 dolichyl-phosphate beta-D-mannosyltransferase [Balneola sp.]HAH52487.1 dolichyl-phosphate beta-D-mannosyltransferase [Balneola sp.]HAW79236.1 dolichyl-phosphate beta-D-mannosyltransferase [Balneola sp.]|tara:strand:+ start:6479 stop:7204 length:726 start_codon:yes stop_codon:yes gene_type:complete
MDKALIIIPTYNEATNIVRMIDRLMALDFPIDVLVVDDGSPDGTAQNVRIKQKEYPDKVHLIERESKQGLGTAYVRGFEFALQHSYEYILEMDADFSHRPEDALKLIMAVKNGDCDVAVGSRYCKGISIINWPLSRLILSYAANIYARTITGLPIFDTTAGFKCLRRSVIEAIPLKRIESNGYAFQIELHFRAWKAGFKLKEVSIVFKERQEGVSKMSKAIVREAIWRVWALKFRSIFGAL